MDKSKALQERVCQEKEMNARTVWLKKDGTFIAT